MGRRSSQLRAICGMVLPVSSAISVEDVDHAEEELVLDRRAVVGGVVQTAALGQRTAAADLAGEPAPAQRAPDDRADALVEPEGHQLPLVVAADERVVDLVGDIARVAVPVGGGEGLHQLPAREVGDAGVADLPRPYELVERGEHLLDRGGGVEGVQLEEVDVVGAEAPQRILASP